MTPRSAGVLLFRRTGGGALEVLLVHPGGPFWRTKDRGAWQIPKGAIEPGEDPAMAARREVREELGVALEGPLLALGEIKQAGGKRVEAFAIEREMDAAAIVSNLFELEWPPRSGKLQSFPEVDRAMWFTLQRAREMMLPSQLELLDRLVSLLE